MKCSSKSVAGGVGCWGWVVGVRLIVIFGVIGLLLGAVLLLLGAVLLLLGAVLLLPVVGALRVNLSITVQK
jgi:hypothetical protein